jgi:hypothetical protein
MTNERTHYSLSSRNIGIPDLLLYRKNGAGFAYVSLRENYVNDSSAGFNQAVISTIPNDNNMNAGMLPNGDRYLLHNPLNQELRDPLIISTSVDGLNFSSAYVGITCTLLNDTTTSADPCKPKYAGKYKNSGPSYAQGLAIAPPNKAAGFYFVATNNKEDVWVTYVPLGSLGL